ncbi:cation-transporting P-type ATPase [Streptomyces sp. NPDC053560]|uniref:cation-transporting P-type ATPase n=1 Tax=Streptomyces sp. NPDC053560 TaxID=3365711 RepID=UPI0037D6E8EC
MTGAVDPPVGLSAARAAESLSRDGPNALPEEKPEPGRRRFLAQYRSDMSRGRRGCGGNARWNTCCRSQPSSAWPCSAAQDRTLRPHPYDRPGPHVPHRRSRRRGLPRPHGRPVDQHGQREWRCPAVSLPASASLLPGGAPVLQKHP